MHLKHACPKKGHVLLYKGIGKYANLGHRFGKEKAKKSVHSPKKTGNLRRADAEYPGLVRFFDRITGWKTA